MREIKYLGFIIRRGQIFTDPEKIKASKEFPISICLKQLRSFFGLSGWYRRFVENYATLSFPQTELLKSKKTLSWNEEAGKEFDLLKSCLTSAPILIAPDFSKQFILLCDASAYGIGSVLAQELKGLELPIAYMSEKLSKCQRNYTVSELECLAAKGTKQFRPYIEGQNFLVVTDHAALQWLMRQKDLLERLARCSMKLQSFNFSITHRRASENIVTDALSRLVQPEIESMVASRPIVDLHSDQFRSTKYLSLIDRIKENQERLQDFKVINGYVYKRTELAEDGDNQKESWKLWVFSVLIPDVLHQAHDAQSSAHCGLGKTVEKIKRYLFWPRMVSQISE